MKKTLIDFVASQGGQCDYSGKWPQTLYVRGANAEAIIESLYKKFGRHTLVKFVS